MKQLILLGLARMFNLTRSRVVCMKVNTTKEYRSKRAVYKVYNMEEKIGFL